MNTMTERLFEVYVLGDVHVHLNERQIDRFDRTPGRRRTPTSRPSFNPFFYTPPGDSSGFDFRSIFQQRNAFESLQSLRERRARDELTRNRLLQQRFQNLFTRGIRESSRESREEPEDTNNMTSILEALRTLIEDYPETEVSFQINEMDARRTNETNTHVSQLLNTTNVSIIGTEFVNNESHVCAICHNEFETNDIIRRINSCGHFFHINCIDTWYATHTSCPICRNNIEPTI